MKLITLAVTLILTLLGAPTWAAERGYFGLSTSVDGEGFFMNPTLKSIKVVDVVPNSPAAKAGIVLGDYIVEVEGKPVAGTKADVLKPYMTRDVGQSTRIVIKKATGETVPVVLVAVSKPQGK